MPKTSDFHYTVMNEIPLDKVKAQCKQYRVPFTIGLNGVLAKSIREYFDRRRDRTRLIHFLSMFTLKPIPSSIEEIRCGNFLTPVLTPMHLESDLKTCIAKAKEEGKKIGFNYALGIDGLLDLTI